ncbi:MAG: hypothetical protein R6V58_17220 [Planctomycetota bacterium]
MIKTATRIVFLLVVAASAGCLQIEQSITMHEDGGATIRERVRFSRPLRQLDQGTPKEQKLVRLLDRKHALLRAKQMGRGCRLVRHEVEDLQNGARESRAVYKIPNIEDLRLLNPYVQYGRPGRKMRLRFTPIYRRVHSFHKVGDLMMALVPAEPEERRGGKDEEPPPEPTPAESQMLRDLRPVFADLMKGLQVTVKLTATKPIPGGTIRHRRSGGRTITLLSFSHKDLDRHGRRFVDNEEAMLSLLRLKFQAGSICDHTTTFTNNLTVPVSRGRYPYASTRFRIKPTKALFKKYYHGRPVSQGGDVPDGKK